MSPVEIAAWRAGAEAMRRAAIDRCGDVCERNIMVWDAMRRGSIESRESYERRRAAAGGRAHGATICAIELDELPLPEPSP